MKATSGWMQKSIANFWPSTKTASSSHLLKSPSFHNISDRVSVWQKYCIGLDCLAHDQSENFLGPFFFSPKVSYQMFCRSNVLQTDAECRMQKRLRDVNERLSLGYRWPTVIGSRMLSSQLHKHFDTRGRWEDDYRPESLFPSRLIEQKKIGTQRMCKRM